MKLMLKSKVVCIQWRSKTQNLGFGNFFFFFFEECNFHPKSYDNAGPLKIVYDMFSEFIKSSNGVPLTTL